MTWKQTVFGYGSLQTLNCQRSRAQCLQLPSRWKPHHSPLEYNFYRHYASVHDERHAADYSWPTSQPFTPYDIFRQEPTAPYSKRSFYELVKVYHPDRRGDDSPKIKDVSEEVRLQRYRLIVAAHEILSDPEKRAAYDRDGTGWHNHPDYPDYPDPRIHLRTYGYPADYDTSIFSNSTWEDWERYHNRHNPKQEQIVSHGTFVTFIVLLVLFGGFAQASWITQTQIGLDQRIREMNVESARLLAKHRQQTDELKSRERRVQRFLIRRDPTGSGLKEEEENVYKQALDRQTGLSGTQIGEH